VKSTAVTNAPKASSCHGIGVWGEPCRSLRTPEDGERNDGILKFTSQSTV
jgi:hypothetical protein